MYHDAVRAGSDISVCTRERIVNAFFEDKTFNPRDDHKLLCTLCRLARCDFCREIFNRVLCLRNLCPKEGVALCPCLVLDDDGGDADALNGAHVVGKMLCRTARVHIEDDGLCRHIHHLVDGLDAIGKVNQLNIGLTARSRVTEA